MEGASGRQGGVAGRPWISRRWLAPSTNRSSAGWHRLRRSVPLPPLLPRRGGEVPFPPFVDVRRFHLLSPREARGEGGGRGATLGDQRGRMVQRCLSMGAARGAWLNREWQRRVLRRPSPCPLPSLASSGGEEVKSAIHPLQCSLLPFDKAPSERGRLRSHGRIGACRSRRLKDWPEASRAAARRRRVLDTPRPAGRLDATRSSVGWSAADPPTRRMNRCLGDAVSAGPGGR